MKQLYAFFSLLLATILLSGAIRPAIADDESSDIHDAMAPNRSIVVFDQSTTDQERDAILSTNGAVHIKRLHGIHGSVASVDKATVRRLSQNKKVLRIDPDVEVHTLATRAQRTPSQPAQVLPWGISRISAPTVWPVTTADPIKVGIIDTGVQTNHPDLQSNIKGGFNTINPTRSYSDDNGHGTHVAGIIAAVNNTVGVVGVAPKADIYAVKALDRNGSGYLSDIIEGIDWAIANNMRVVNMSLGASVDVQSFHDAVIRAKNAGVTVVAAAGNNYGGVVSYPGAYSEVISVSSTNSSNAISSFSSVGPEVDIAAPGESVYSTYIGSSYATLSGTSMATPHVTGAVALLLSVPSKCDTDSNGSCSPDEVKSRLESTATDLGALGRDNLFGAGLLNVAAALQ